MSHRTLHRFACGAFVTGSAAAYLVALAPDGRRGLLYLLLHGTLTGAMLLAWCASNRRPVAERRSAFRAMLVAGLATRLLLVPIATFTSTDVVRYLWDGRVALLGLDPYTSAPDAVRAALADWPEPAVHRSLPTVYPPVALGLFAFAASFGPSAAWWVWKIMVAAASCATVVLTAMAVGPAAPGHLALVALSPLLVLEGGIGAHVDIVAALAVAVAVVCRQRRRVGAATAALALGACVKPLLALAVFAIVCGSRARLRVAAAATSVLAIVGVASRMMGWSLIGSLPAFAARWRFGSPVFSAASTVGEGFAWGVAIITTAVALAIAACAVRRGHWTAGALWAMTAPLLAGPVVFPWYLTPLVPLLALAPSFALVAWITTIPLTYEVIDLADAAGRWEPASWPLVGITAGWVVGAIGSHRSRPKEHA